ncbi:MAG: type II secretion system F family protein [Planctomycetota bacterium]|jgi:type IV pilus assembly protein PilC
MARFGYVALRSDGRPVEGALDAPDERTAAARIQEQSLFITRLTAEAPPARRRPRPIRAQRLAFFFRELALMTRSGVTLLAALRVCEERSASAPAGALAGRLAERIRGGRSLSRALADEPRIPRLAVRLVQSGETTGELDPALDRIAEIIEHRAALRRSLVTSIAYPAVVFCVSIAVAVFLVVAIVPKFAAFFARRGIAMPATTSALIELSNWIREHGLSLLVAALAVAGAIVAMQYSRRFRAPLHRTALRIPIVGRLWQVASLCQITWTLGALLRSGVTLIESIRVTAASVGNRALGDHLATLEKRVLSGESLSRGLEDPLLPRVVPSLVAAGEQSGAITDVLDELARFYQADLDQRIRRMSSLVEPVLILIVGGMVGFVYLSFFQALMQLAKR